MRKKEVVYQFINDICVTFPELRPLINQIPQNMPVLRIETFAKETTRAFEQDDLIRGQAYLAFMSHRLTQQHPIEFEYIDVYYVENLFSPQGSKAARIGWPLMPPNLKELFLKFHRKSPI